MPRRRGPADERFRPPGNAWSIRVGVRICTRSKSTVARAGNRSAVERKLEIRLWVVEFVDSLDCAVFSGGPVRPGSSGLSRWSADGSPLDFPGLPTGELYSRGRCRLGDSGFVTAARRGR